MSSEYWCNWILPFFLKRCACFYLNFIKPHVYAQLHIFYTKLTHCWGCILSVSCCDVRRATIIVNIICVILALIEIFVYLAIGGNTGQIVLLLITCVMSAGAIFDAIKFRWFLVALNVPYMLISNLVGAVLAGAYSGLPLQIFTLLLIVLFIHPQVMFIREIRSNIMSKENYVNEKMSCCCV